MIEIAILGHGVVGSGVVEVLATHKDSILKRAQNEINIKSIEGYFRAFSEFNNIGIC